MRHIHRLAAVAAMAITSLAAAGQTSLSFDSTVVDGHGTIGKFSGSLNWSHLSGAGTATLTVTLKNLAETLAGGKLTGFVLNKPAAAGLTYSLATKPNASWSMTGAAANAAPFGSYSLGAALGGNWIGGGNPNPGIHIGDEFAFNFTVSGLASTLDGLDAYSFWNSVGGNPEFLCRFRGFNNGGSDKSPAQLQASVVPIPAPLLLGGAGLAIAGVLRRRVK